jgi:hypothetical protein
MKIIWADHDPSWGVSNPSWDEPSREETGAEALKAKESSPSGITEEAAQEKSSWKEQKRFG